MRNRMLFEVEAVDGGKPMKLVRPSRAPQASEHTETILLEFGLPSEGIEELKEKKVIA